MSPWVCTLWKTCYWKKTKPLLALWPVFELHWCLLWLPPTCCQVVQGVSVQGFNDQWKRPLRRETERESQQLLGLEAPSLRRAAKGHRRPPNKLHSLIPVLIRGLIRATTCSFFTPLLLSHSDTAVKPNEAEFHAALPMMCQLRGC